VIVEFIRAHLACDGVWSPSAGCYPRHGLRVAPSTYYDRLEGAGPTLAGRCACSDPVFLQILGVSLDRGRLKGGVTNPVSWNLAEPDGVPVRDHGGRSSILPRTPARSDTAVKTSARMLTPRASRHLHGVGSSNSTTELMSRVPCSPWSA
jgi:hypothetical protein